MEQNSHMGTYNLLESKQEDDTYTEDGTVDYLKNPANKKKKPELGRHVASS